VATAANAANNLAPSVKAIFPSQTAGVLTICPSQTASFGGLEHRTFAESRLE
jgi:hypothetical protein